MAALPQQSDINFHPPELPELSRKETAAKQTGEKLSSKGKNVTMQRSNVPVRQTCFVEEGPIVRTTSEGDPLAVGFFVNWDDSSIASLKENINSLDWVVPEWIRLSGNVKDPLVLDIDENAISFIQATKPEMPVLPPFAKL